MPADKHLQRQIRQAIAARDAARAAADAAYVAALRDLWEQGYSLAQIAEALGVSRQRVHQLVQR